MSLAKSFNNFVIGETGGAMSGAAIEEVAQELACLIELVREHMTGRERARALAHIELVKALVPEPMEDDE